MGSASALSGRQVSCGRPRRSTRLELLSVPLKLTSVPALTEGAPKPEPRRAGIRLDYMGAVRNPGCSGAIYGLVERATRIYKRASLVSSRRLLRRPAR